MQSVRNNCLCNDFAPASMKNHLCSLTITSVFFVHELKFPSVLVANRLFFNAIVTWQSASFLKNVLCIEA